MPMAIAPPVPRYNRVPTTPAVPPINAWGRAKYTEVSPKRKQTNKQTNKTTACRPRAPALARLGCVGAYRSGGTTDERGGTHARASEAGLRTWAALYPMAMALKNITATNQPTCV